jgi:hypothetical protein
MTPLALPSSVSTLAAWTRPLNSVSLIVVILLLVVALLVIVRMKLTVPYSAAMKAPTWGCGYAFPTPRMQYTGSSFAAALVHLARQVLRTRRQRHLPRGYFPTSGEMATSTPDVALSRGFEPLFARLARLLQRCWPLQHGRVQLYLIYIVAALMLVFLIEFCWRVV